MSIDWAHWHLNQIILCPQERPLGVWSHEQNAPSGPRLFHPGKKTTEFENPPIIDFQAMDFLAEQLRHPIFVIVTDDPGWAKGQIPPGFRPFFTGENILDWSLCGECKLCKQKVKISLGFYNESVQDSAGLDLAVLASCNYTILSRFLLI